MLSTFLTLRYTVFALLISFHSVICTLAALNLGSLIPNTAHFPQVDNYLIFLGVLGLVVVFSVIFVELIRKNAFIARVLVEITWVGILWVMNLSGAAAITAIMPTIQCTPTTQEPNISCVSTKVLLAFTWLCTITLLFYLLGLVICAVHHSQEDSRVWRSGVRDYRWFTQRKPLEFETKPFYGKLVDPRELSGPPAVYAQQMGLARNYSIEPLRMYTNVERPAPPVPVVSSKVPAIPFGTDSYLFPHDAPLPPSSTQSYSLYPQHLQATGGVLPAVPARTGERSPPPAGLWPRSRPQEPARRKERPAKNLTSNFSSNAAPAAVSAQSYPEMAGQGIQTMPLSNAGRSRPSGPRTPSTSQRPRPPPLDLSRVSSYPNPER